MTTGTVVYDADCGFCTTCATWLESHGTCGVVSWQSLDLAAHGLTVEQVTEAAYWLDAEGRPTAHGHQAIAQALRTCGAGYRVLGRVVGARVVAPVASRVYRQVAAHRHQLPGGTAACEMPRR